MTLPSLSPFPLPLVSFLSQNLAHLQLHKQNIFEVSLPNRVTKITEASAHSSVRSAIANVLKKYGYTLEVMEVRFTNTMQVSALLINGSGQVRSCYNY